jgi:hypothetical protein
MKNNVSISSQVFDELLTTIEVIGLDKTIQTLKDVKANSLILNDMNIDFIITSVSSITNVQKDRILNGADRNDDRKIAISLCVYFIKTEFSYTYSEIKNIFNKGESALSRYNTLIEKSPKNPKTQLDKKISEYIKKINLLIQEKKLTNGK